MLCTAAGHRRISFNRWRGHSRILLQTVIDLSPAISVEPYFRLVERQCVTLQLRKACKFVDIRRTNKAPIKAQNVRHILTDTVLPQTQVFGFWL